MDKRKHINLKGFVEFSEEPSTGDDWLIENLWPRESLIMVSGPPKLGMKSWSILQAAYQLATGTSYKYWKVPEPGKVLFVEEEGAARKLRERFVKVARGMGRDIYTKITGEGRDQVIQHEWRDCPPDDLLRENFLVTHRPGLKLDDPAWMDLMQRIVEDQKPAVVMLDALSFMHNGNENLVQDMQVVTDSLKVLREMGPSVVYVYHSRKGYKKGQDIDDEVRGSSLLAGVYDTHIAHRRESKQKPVEVYTRHRDYEEQCWSMWWDIKRGPQGTASLTLKDPNDLTTEQVYKKITTDGGLIPGESYPHHRFQDALDTNELGNGKSEEIKEELVQAGMLMFTPDKKSFVIINQKNK